LTVLTAGLGGAFAGRKWAISSAVGGLIALTHLIMVVVLPKGGPVMYVLSTARLAVVGLLLYAAIDYGIAVLPMVVGLGAVYMGLMGGLLADHARNR